MSELAVGSLVPASGAPGLASVLGAAQGGMQVRDIAVAYFVLKSAVNYEAGYASAARWSMWMRPSTSATPVTRTDPVCHGLGEHDVAAIRRASRAITPIRLVRRCGRQEIITSYDAYLGPLSW